MMNKFSLNILKGPFRLWCPINRLINKAPDFLSGHACEVGTTVAHTATLEIPLFLQGRHGIRCHDSLQEPPRIDTRVRERKPSILPEHFNIFGLVSHDIDDRRLVKGFTTSKHSKRMVHSLCVTMCDVCLGYQRARRGPLIDTARRERSESGVVEER